MSSLVDFSSVYPSLNGILENILPNCSWLDGFLKQFQGHRNFAGMLSVAKSPLEGFLQGQEEDIQSKASFILASKTILLDFFKKTMQQNSLFKKWENKYSRCMYKYFV